MSKPVASVLKAIPDEDLDDFINIVANAYPSIKLFGEEARQKFKQRTKGLGENPTLHLYGLYREGQLQGSMRMFDFTMKLLSVKAPAGGVGLVAVDLLHKKEKVAKDLIAYFLQYYRERGTSIALLYPFRPDFYKQMGFGYGTKLNQYRIKPASLPSGGAKEQVEFLKKDDEQSLLDCYNRYLELTNGLIEKKSHEIRALFDNAENKIIVYRAAPTAPVTGYLVFNFKSTNPDNFMLNNMVVKELAYESSEALLGLLAFLHSQADQISNIILYSQDDTFHYLLTDPRNGNESLMPHVFHESNVQGIGLMYRVIDTKGIFKTLANHNFGGQNCKLKLSIRDSFLKANDGSLIIHFEEGRPRLSESGEYAVEIGLDVSDFSSLLMGTVDFKNLYRYGLVRISEPSYIETLQRLFLVDQKPICFTAF